MENFSVPTNNMTDSLPVRILKKILGDNFYLIHSLNIQSLDGWFYSSLKNQHALSKARLAPFGAYYEFGSAGGNTLIKFLLALRVFCRKNNLMMSDYHIFVFDTFEGMPETDLKEDIQRGWSEGDFVFSVEQLKKNISDAGINLDGLNIRFIKGNFSDSLTPQLRDELRQHPPSIVNVDVDHYSSTKIVLDWLTPILNSGVLFYFDDYWAFHGNPEYGQIKAINEFNKKDLGYLITYPRFGMSGNSMIFSKKVFEYI